MGPRIKPSNDSNLPSRPNKLFQPTSCRGGVRLVWRLPSSPGLKGSKSVHAYWCIWHDAQDIVLPPDNRFSKNNVSPSSNFAWDGGLNLGDGGGVCGLANSVRSGAAMLCDGQTKMKLAKPTRAHVRRCLNLSFMRPKVSGLISTWNGFYVQVTTLLGITKCE